MTFFMAGQRSPRILDRNAESCRSSGTGEGAFDNRCSMPILSFLRSARTTLVVTATVLAACSPTFNWREVPVGDADVVVLLPCKPDRATRQLPLGTDMVPVDMAG